jgi:hypothetical protein
MWSGNWGSACIETKPAKRNVKKRKAIRPPYWGIELPKEDFERVDDKDKVELAEATAQAEEDIRQLMTRLLDKGYNWAAYFFISCE